MHCRRIRKNINEEIELILLGTMCQLYNFLLAVSACAKPIFSSRQVTKNAKKHIGPEIEPPPAKLYTCASTTGALPDTAIMLLRDRVQTERRKFFRKLRGILGFHMTPMTEQPKVRCVWGLGLRSTFQTEYPRRRPSMVRADGPSQFQKLILFGAG